jgi:hypothetical protein
MQREVWTREEVRNALLATYFSTVAARRGSQEDDYLDGFRAAIVALALNFGLPTAPYSPGSAPAVVMENGKLLHRAS